jgi:hypothetical protein
MTLPPDQRMLYDDLAARLDNVAGQDDLIVVMARLLRTLLRRKGDGEFLAAVQDAFSEGIAGRSWEEQAALARQVLRVVIETRPEIARAWQAMNANGQAEPQHRRAADVVSEPAPVPPPLPEIEPFYAYASARALVTEYMAEELHRRLALFQVPPPGFPCAAYCHDKPFFLFTHAFYATMRGFVSGPLLDACSIGLERRIYRHASDEILADPEQSKAFLFDKRAELWRLITQRLTKLAAAHRTAEAKLAAATASDGSPEVRLVDVPATRPRVYRIFGVQFAFGSETTVRRVRVNLPPAFELEPQEHEALDLLTTLHDMAAAEGLDLPSSVDFQVLRTLLSFDARRFAQAWKELSALAGHEATSRAYLFERLGGLDEQFNIHLSDILVVMLFYCHGDRGFGFRALYDICVGAARQASAVVSRRPFLPGEVGRRPRELAFQLREALRRRLPATAVATAAELLLEACETMARSRFAHELAAARTVLAAFPLVFAGEADEAALIAVGQAVQSAIDEPPGNRRAFLTALARSYGGADRKA